MQNLDELMKMAQEAQAKLLEAQEGLDRVIVEGASGGGLVKIRASAKADVAAQGAMQDVTGGLQLPPGFKMPF